MASEGYPTQLDTSAAAEVSPSVVPPAPEPEEAAPATYLEVPTNLSPEAAAAALESLEAAIKSTVAVSEGSPAAVTSDGQPVELTASLAAAPEAPLAAAPDVSLESATEASPALVAAPETPPEVALEGSAAEPAAPPEALLTAESGASLVSSAYSASDASLESSVYQAPSVPQVVPVRLTPQVVPTVGSTSSLDSSSYVSDDDLPVRYMTQADPSDDVSTTAGDSVAHYVTNPNVTSKELSSESFPPFRLGPETPQNQTSSATVFNGRWVSSSTSSMISIIDDTAIISKPGSDEESIADFMVSSDRTCSLGNLAGIFGKMSEDGQSILWSDDDVWSLRASPFSAGQKVKVTMIGTLVQKEGSGFNWVVKLGDDSLASVDEDDLEPLAEGEAEQLNRRSHMKKARHSKIKAAKAAAMQAATAASAATHAATAATKVVTGRAVAHVADAKKVVTVGAAAMATGAAAAGARASKVGNWFRGRFSGAAGAPSQPETSKSPLLETVSDTSPEDTVCNLNKARFIVDNPGKVHDFYDIERRKLGEGSYASVSKCTNKSSGATRALKSNSKAGMKDAARFQQEIAIMKLMDHPNIIKLYETFEDNRNIYLILELCTGGELFDRIIEAGHFTESQAAILMQQMIRSVFYMHESHVTHRDLKPENFLLQTKDPVEKAVLKVIDFGLSCRFEDSQVLTTKAGTPYYVAPQVLAGKYDKSADLWSLGVLMYVLLCGYPPFFGETDADVLSKVRLGNYSFNALDWKNISEDAKNLVRMLLKMNPKDRYSAEEALNHNWIKNKAPNAASAPLPVKLIDNLRTFRSQPKFKKAALHVMASQLGESQIKALRETFLALDANGDGLLTFKEMKEGMGRCGLATIPPDLQQIMEEVDSDGSGAIDYTEFLAATLDMKVFMEEDVCWQAFRVFDRNGDGKIDKDELRQVLENSEVQTLTERTLTEIMEEADQNGDGQIDFQEFMKMMRGGD